MNWMNLIISISVILVFIGINKIYKYGYIKYKMMLSLVVMIVEVVVLDLSFLEVFLATLFLSTGFFMKSLYEEVEDKSDFEIFFIDRNEIKCLAYDKESNYKSYAMNPKNFIRTYKTKNVDAIFIKNNSLILMIDNKNVICREINDDNITEIIAYIKHCLPHIIGDEEMWNHGLNNENTYYLHKFIILSPIVFLSAVIYFFANNGRDGLLTFVCMGLMLVLPWVLSKMLQRK